MNRNVGENIREIREERNMTQAQLSELTRLNRVTIAKYESGRVEPGVFALSRIADVLDVSTDMLLGREETGKLSNEDADTLAMREMYRRDPNYRILFSTANKAKPEHLRAAVAVLKALMPEDKQNDSGEPDDFPET